MAKLFGRNYQLIIQVKSQENQPSETIVIKPPLRISFSAEKSSYGGRNSLNLSVYNLNRENQIKLRVDPSYPEDVNKPLANPISLKVGYGNDLIDIFLGSIFKANTLKQGADMVTTIECIDGLTGNREDFITESAKRGSVKST